MMSKKSTRGSRQRSDFGWRNKIIQWAVDDRDITYVTQWLAGTEVDAKNIIERLTDVGIKVKFSFSEYYDSYVGTITFGEYHKHLEGYSVVAYHRDLTKLLGLLLYIIDVCVENDDTRLHTQNGAAIDW